MMAKAGIEMFFRRGKAREFSALPALPGEANEPCFAPTKVLLHG
jgi:hypothetical protein